METFLIAFEAIVPLFLVILAGALFSKTKASSEHWVEVLNKYALWIGFPALVIASLMNLDTAMKSYLPLILINGGYIVACIFLAFPIAALFGLTNKMKRTLFLILPFGNTAYLGIPVLNNALGNSILPVAAIISAIYVFLLLTLAIILIEIHGQQKINLKNLIKSLAQNPLLLSVFIGLGIAWAGIRLPDFAEKTIHLFSRSVTAVVLFSLGIFLGMHPLGKLKNWIHIFGWSVIIMIVLPAALFGLLQFSALDPVQSKATLLDAAMPLGLTPYVLSVQYRLETTLTARLVVFSTLLSVVVLPLWITAAG